ncbi:MAG: glutamate synthase subunit beta, partial [Chloroflexi bacterium]|nr:glutamate synthase subunit beta [Chloroflexota bacterium]
MGKPTGFIEISRKLPGDRPVEERVHDWREVHEPFPVDHIREQGARCMDCGIPFCNQGCPLGNVIPDWNDLVYRDLWREAIDRLHKTNNFPEFTGRLCPAPCESSCVLGISSDPVTIKQIEVEIIDRAWAEGWVTPEPPATRTGKTVAVIGSGPSGLACAQQLGRAGHTVTVFERADRIGGLLRYGIPEFKMEKRVLDRRVDQMTAEGVIFRPNTNAGVDISAADLRQQFDAVVLACGSTKPFDLSIPGRELKGIYYAMEFLPQANRFAHGEIAPNYISAEGKRVVIIGGGDTGADCLGTVNRQGRRSVHQFELFPEPPPKRTGGNPWPQFARTFKTTPAHEEGCNREYSINTKEFLGDENGCVRALRTVRVQMVNKDGRMVMEDVPGSEEIIEAELVLLAMGFAGPEKNGLLEELGVEFGMNGRFEHVKSDHTRSTGVPGVFVSGDVARGQSLIVWAITEGRHTAHHVDAFLMGHSDLPAPLRFGNEVI